MKNVFLFLILFIFLSCGSTKEIKTKNTDSVSKIEKIKDTITSGPSVTKTKQETLPAPLKPAKQLNEEDTNDYHPEAFNHTSWHMLLQKYVSKDGVVNYEGFKANRKELLAYIDVLSQHLPNTSWNTEDILAYWINAYNAMTIDLILRHYPVKSIKDIKNPWDQRYWKLGDKWYNLNDIEHQILRKMDEPRIHFAIVCASISCPNLSNEAFTALNLDNQLTQATKAFLTDNSKNSISKTELELSKIFQWFAKDFKQNGTLIDFLNQYLDIEVSAEAKKRFKDYNWDLNN